MPTLYRKRLIPEECVLLKDDVVLYQDDQIIVTSWHSLKPRRDLHHGYSCYYLDRGIKVSKFYRPDNTLLYWYCDIVDYDYDSETDAYLVTDLLADVIVYPDGFVKVVDLDELAVASDRGILSDELLKKSLLRLDALLKIIYGDSFCTLQEPINSREKQFSCI